MAEGDGDHEFQKPRIPSAVKEPSPEEKEAHLLSGCATYRSWCPHCVASQSRGNPHKKSGEVGEIPVLAFDYGFLCEAKGAIPMIVGRDSHSQSHAATFVQHKGRDAYAVSYLTAWVKGLGYRKVVFKSDNERALLALLDLVKRALVDVEVVPETSPETDSQANGLAELGVQTAKGRTRAIRSALEATYGTKIGEDEPVLAWIPRHAVNCRNRYAIGSDGRTPEQRRTGRKWKRPVVQFGEVASLNRSVFHDRLVVHLG